LDYMVLPQFVVGSGLVCLALQVLLVVQQRDLFFVELIAPVE